MKLYSIEELSCKGGKIDKKDLIGLGETWVADLSSKLDEKNPNKETRKIIEVGLFLVACIFDFIGEGDLK